MSSPSQINEDEELASRLAVESKTPNYHPMHPHQLTTEERDNAIIRWIKLQVEDHLEFSLYTESKAKMPHLSKVIKQYMIVSVMLGQLSGMITPIDYDGAPSCTVKMNHVLRALHLDSAWDEAHHETLTFLSWYGPNGTRYEDSRVHTMIEDNSASIAMLQQLFRLIDTAYTEDVLGSSSQQIKAKAKRCKLSANTFVDIAAVEDDEQEDSEEDSEELVCRPQAVEPSGKLSFQQRIDAIINQFDRRTPEQTTHSWLEVLQVLEGIVLPLKKSIFIVDFFSAGARTFSCKYMSSRGLQVMTLPWLPHRLYIKASSPLEVQKNLPSSHHHAYKEVVHLPSQEGTSLTVFKSHKTLPCQSWVHIKKSTLYKGNVGYVESSDQNTAAMIVAPCQRPYDITKQLANLDLEPILSSSGAAIGYICSGQHFVHGLLRLSLPVHALEVVEIPHPDDIKYHTNTQFWREKDEVEIHEGDLAGMVGTLGNINLAERTAIVICNDHDFHCSLCKLRRKFSLGNMVKIIAGPFGGDTGYVVDVWEDTIAVAIIQENGMSDNVKVSKYLVQSYLQEHVWSCSTEHIHGHAYLPLPSLSRDEEEGVLAGDVVVVYSGPYIGKRGTIEWITPDGMVLMDLYDLHVEPAPHTLSLSKDKGYNVAVGNIVEVARGTWHCCQGVVNTVDFTKALIEMVCSADGKWITMPITLCCKIKECSDSGLSSFIGRDVWVISGDKKGTRAMLHSIGRMTSLVALFGHQLIQLKNNQIATPTGLLLDGTALPAQLLQALMSLHSLSFMTAPVPLHTATPPPSPAPSDAPLEAPWVITPNDITPPEGLPNNVTQSSTSNTNDTLDYDTFLP
ncbi:hypothetical protein SCLCIDRAFT_28198 [Scleroderma citrinum Foug A]|uniref:KOW domain-containing protein n=1 Tax=Scleroderma citrinum Foug A TaxID=1036808 RepID=A0A0C2Z8P8_9AGAM|nr:hypothetical protein SCLCIDRAFT_28198 [Scleroderma citrinum Foug A]